MPRLKNIYAQKLARPVSGEPEAYPHLQLILSRPIDWDLIKEQYDQQGLTPLPVLARLD